MALQPIMPLVYEVVEKTTEQTTVADVLLGALAIIGGVVVVCFLLGLGCAGVLIALRKLQGQDRLAGAGSESTRLGLNSSSR